MEQKDKDLLLKDLCGRLPYGVKIRIEYPFLKEEERHSEILYGLDLQRLCLLKKCATNRLKGYFTTLTEVRKRYLHWRKLIISNG